MHHFAAASGQSGVFEGIRRHQPAWAMATVGVVVVDVELLALERTASRRPTR